jgi:hypothetical protein
MQTTMTFSINTTDYTINMNDRTIYHSGPATKGRNYDLGFDHYNAEDCETAEEVKEMIEEYIVESES